MLTRNEAQEELAGNALKVRIDLLCDQIKATPWRRDALVLVDQLKQELKRLQA